MRLVLSLVLAIWLGSPALVLAMDPSFTIGPAKNEFTLLPGGSVTKNIAVTNNLGRSSEFTIKVSDFKDTPVQYALKNYLTLGTTKLIIPNGESATVPVTVTLPANLPPTGLYAAVNIIASPAAQGGGAQVSTAISSLFFVRVAGEATPAGALTAFGPIGGAIQLFKNSFNFHYSFRNDGNIYLNPYGAITIERRLAIGKEGQLPVLPNFVLPGETRLREVKFLPTYSCGWFKATLQLNRGYDDIIDTKNTSFFTCSPLAVGSILSLLFIILLAGWWLMIKLKR
ncbi:MAG: hypothetical protein KBC48_00480 [Candidatus Pacebacteria bacterium]|nr:hypothetical protein [Candidatus Paceibacterota bacterium]